MKRSSGIILGGLSATLLTTAGAFGSGLLTTDVGAAPPVTDAANAAGAADAASPDAAAPQPAASDTTASDATVSDATVSDATVAGDPVASRYGTFQAQITVENGVMTAIEWLQAGEADLHSQRINAQAIPELEAAILDAQSADVGYISGASFTSEAVEAAVASAMHEAGLA